jgi:hypothetical protein
MIYDSQGVCEMGSWDPHGLTQNQEKTISSKLSHFEREGEPAYPGFMQQMKLGSIVLKQTRRQSME